MRPGPSKRMEAAAAFLIPPACREEVLGDLYERYKSKTQYIVDVVRTLPLVLWSQMRRTIDPRILLLEALAVYLSFLAIQWMVVGPSDFLRLAIPSLVALLGVRVAAVYSSRPWIPILAISFAFPFQTGLPLWTTALGAILAGLLLLVVRRSFPQRENDLRAATPTAGQIITLDDIRRKTLEFQVQVSRRNLREYVAAALVFVSVGWNFSKEPLGGGVIIVGVAYVVYSLRTRGSARAAPQDADFTTYRNFHRSELERQRDLLRAIWSWYLRPMIPGIAVVVARAAIRNPRPWQAAYMGLVLLFFLGIAKLNHAGARRLQRKIDELDAMEAQR